MANTMSMYSEITDDMIGRFGKIFQLPYSLRSASVSMYTICHYKCNAQCGTITCVTLISATVHCWDRDFVWASISIHM